MKSRVRAALVVSAIVIAASAGPAGAAPIREQVSITAFTTFVGELSPFISSLDGCESGEVANGPANFAFTPVLGVFAGFKIFDCEGGEGGFVLRLNATFGPEGSVGTWSVVDASGSLGGMQGSGKLVGVPFPDGTGITDIYSGTVLLRT